MVPRPPAPIPADPDDRAEVTRSDQLPARAYPVPADILEIFSDEAAFRAIARPLEEDLREDLARFRITDPGTLKTYHQTLAWLAWYRGDGGGAVAHLDAAAALEPKPASRQVAGLVERALLAAPGDAEGFRAALRARLRELPYRRVQAELKTLRTRMEVATPALVQGDVRTRAGRAAAGGTVSRELAQHLVAARHHLDHVEPVRRVAAEELAAVIASFREEKADIWAGREVSLEGTGGLTPVTIGIWDSGVDAACFPQRLHVDPEAVGLAAHGVAYDVEGERSPHLLMPLSFGEEKAAEVRRYFKGRMDLIAGVESEAADALRGRVASMDAGEAKSFLEDLAQYTLHMHGTHVAGIAARGNPAARILIARLGFSYTAPPREPTLAWAAEIARVYRETCAYFRRQGARVVNMSWVFTPGAFELGLEANDAGGSPAERRRLAREVFTVMADTLRDAIAGAPEILFVAGAGNADEDNRFSETVPASFRLPNLISAGAVDRAGDETAFTSFGGVEVFANGYEVESVVPGGTAQTASGSSMASPQVANLAGKLFALYPGATVDEVRTAIREGAETREVEGRTLRLLHPARSLELLAARRGGPGRTR